MNTSELVRRQELMASCLGKLLVFACNIPDITVTMAEGYVGDTDAADKDYDGPHVKGGCHYARLAQDINIRRKGILVNGDDPIWKRLGSYWKALNPLCCWGGDFTKVDVDHFSVAHPDGIHK